MTINELTDKLRHLEGSQAWNNYKVSLISNYYVDSDIPSKGFAAYWEEVATSDEHWVYKKDGSYQPEFYQNVYDRLLTF
jgi:hypothetical protein